MRILLFSTAYLPFIGGAELAVKEITERLPDIEFDLITAKLKRGLSDFERIGNVNIYRLGAGNKFLDKPLLPNLGFLKAINLHKKKRYDLIHGIMASQGSAAAYLFKFFYPKVPFVLTLQEGDLGRNSPFDRFWQRRVIRKADAITAISSYLVRFAERYNKKAPVFVVPNGVDPRKFSISNSNKVKKEKRIITISRLVPKNGIDILIRAIERVKKDNPGVICHIVGDGWQRKELEKLTKKLGLEKEVRFLGSVSNDEVPKYLAQAVIFVRPSRSEGLGSAFLEAMAAGVPIVGTAVGGIPDFLKDGETGFFCLVENPEDLASKIDMIFNNQILREKLVENAAKLVQEKYGWDRIAAEMSRVYHEAISNYSGI